MRGMASTRVAVVGILVAFGAMTVFGNDAQAVSSYRNCNDDAIVRCGAITENELLQKYDANSGDIQNIYGHYGISRSDLAGANGDIRHGTVYQDGRVLVDGKTVATDAYSLSRTRFTSAGTPKNVTINGTTYYEGPNMGVFMRPVDAYVYFENDEFKSAVISSCGNPLMATPVKATKPVTPVVQETAPEQPVVIVEQPKPVVVTPVAKEVPVALPQTGVADVLSGGVGAGSITAAGYYWLRSRKNLLIALLNR